jgi:siderophore synthetase component
MAITVHITEGKMLRSDYKLEKEEEKIYRYLESSFPHLLDEFFACLSKARFMIMERMVNALLREGFLEQAQIESQLSISNQLEFDWSKGKLIIPISNRYSYNRYKLEGNPLLSENNSMAEIVHPSFLLGITKELDKEQKAEFTNLEGFQAELGDSVANLGLSLLFQSVRMRELHHLISQKNITSIFGLAEELSKIDPDFDESLFFEQLCVTGHLLHPCTKSKIGLTVEEIMQYSPELVGAVKLHFAAIHKDIAYHNPKIPSEDFQRFWLNQYPDLIFELMKCAEETKQDYKDFFLIPVHPWQLKNTLRSLYCDEIGKNQILLLETVISAKPTLSVRTMQPVDKQFHIKLPINIQMTSAVRTISPNSIHNGPEITLMVRDILEKEDCFHQTLNIIGEEIGLRFQSTEQSEPNFRDRNKNLGYIIRKAPDAFLKDGEHAIVACAFFNLSPVTDQPLLYEVIEQFHRQNQANSFKENLLLFFSSYTRVVLSGVMPLMTRYGIGLEAHLQNSLIVLKEWQPVRILIRDLGGVRIAKNRLEQKGFVGSYIPGSATINEDASGMQNKVIHTVFQSHIGELTLSLAEQYDIDEQVFWGIVKEICTDIFRELQTDESIMQNIESDMAALFGDTVQTKALTLMRLKDDVTDYAFISLPNPLSPQN